MPNLQKLQNAFQNYICDEDPHVREHIIGDKKTPADERLNIYRDAYYLRLIESLTIDYPVLYTKLGDKKFSALAHEYIQSEPSCFKSIRWYGAHFCKMFATSDSYHELAIFEWLLTEVFDAENAKPVTIESMAAIPFDAWPTLTFQLTPSLRRMDFSWNIVPVWKAFYEKTRSPKLKQVFPHTPWILWRKQLETQFCSLPKEENYFLDALQRGKNFGNICEGLSDFVKKQEDIPTQAAIILKKFLDAGLIVSFAKKSDL